MENFFGIFPRNGKVFSTPWKTFGAESAGAAPDRGAKKTQGSRSSPASSRALGRPDYFFAGTGVFAYSIAKLA